MEPTDAVWGAPDAPVTIVEFSDFECRYCAAVQATLSALKREYTASQLRLVHKHQPLDGHENAMPAALVSQAVLMLLGDEAFFRYSSRLYADPSRLDSDSLVLFAVEAGVDPQQLNALLDSGQLAGKVEADLLLAARLGVDGTPAFRINGFALSGAQPLERFRELIDAELEAARQLVAAGTPRERVYAERVQYNFERKEAAAEPAADPTVWQVEVGKSPTLGPRDALVTLVEFADYECHYCRQVQPTLERLRQAYPRELRVVFKHNPLPSHPRAEPMAQLAAEALKQRGEAGFWAVHGLLLEASAAPEDAELLKIAKRAGLHVGRVQAALDKELHSAAIRVDRDQAADLGVRGTPHFFINGRRLAGAKPYEAFQELVDEELAKARQAVASGVPRGSYYTKLMQTAKGPPAPEVRQVAPPTPKNPTRGPAAAPIVIQVFTDLECQYCDRVRSTLTLIDQQYPGRVRWVWRNLPLGFHEHAELAAQAALEVFAQKGAKAFWSYTDALFDARSDPNFGRALFEQLALKAGVSAVRFNQALDQGVHLPEIERDKRDAAAAGIRGTPGFMINGYFISGAKSFSHFKRVIDRALEDIRLKRAPGK